MSAPVDVLAVMDRLADYYRDKERLIGPVDSPWSVEHKIARNAVAELIDACAPAVTEEGMTQDELNRLRAALARVGGAA